jgi:hypothetical protein
MAQIRMRRVAVRASFYYYHIGRQMATIIMPDEGKISVKLSSIVGLADSNGMTISKNKKGVVQITPAMMRSWIMANIKQD